MQASPQSSLELDYVVHSMSQAHEVSYSVNCHYNKFFPTSSFPLLKYGYPFYFTSVSVYIQHGNGSLNSLNN